MNLIMNAEHNNTKGQERGKVLPLVEFIIYLLFALGPLTGNIILVLFGVLSADFTVLPSDL